MHAFNRSAAVFLHRSVFVGIFFAARFVDDDALHGARMFSAANPMFGKDKSSRFHNNARGTLVMGAARASMLRAPMPPTAEERLRFRARS
jgi:hypothetical protein